MANSEPKVKKEKKEKKGYFKDFKAELKKVIWPTPKQTVNSTTAVITIVLVTAIIVLCLDLVFETLNAQGINRIKNVISNNNNTVNEEVIDDTNTEESDVNQDENVSEDVVENVEENTDTE